MGFDVITMGRISVDIYPQQVGVSLREVAARTSENFFNLFQTARS